VVWIVTSIVVIGALAIAAIVAVAAIAYLSRPAPAPPTAPPVPAAAPPSPAPAPAGAAMVDDELTIVAFRPMVLDAAVEPSPAPAPAAVRTVEGGVETIIRDPGAEDDEPSAVHALILLSAVAQTHRGRRRKNNEDSFAVVEAHHLFVVADGMGGYAGGEIASKIAVDTIAAAYESGDFGDVPADLPKDGGRLVTAIQRANQAIWAEAQGKPELEGMGTTVVSARFSPGKERVSIGHVGDSRCYRFRRGALEMMTADHTLGALGVEGKHKNALTRAVGIGPEVRVDLILAEPEPGDVFMLCSDGLTKMVPEDEIREVLATAVSAEVAVQALITHANSHGGKDNVTVIIVQVRDARDDAGGDAV
jgi:serine/threonine protein phosphatase PrpC